MSGGGGGPIIIRNLIENPGTTALQKEYLRAMLLKMSDGKRLSLLQQLSIFAIFRGVLRS
jgi:hypothetical protein